MYHREESQDKKKGEPRRVSGRGPAAPNRAASLQAQGSAGAGASTQPRASPFRWLQRCAQTGGLPRREEASDAHQEQGQEDRQQKQRETRNTNRATTPPVSEWEREGEKGI